MRVESGFESYEFAPDSLSVWDRSSREALLVCIDKGSPCSPLPPMYQTLLLVTPLMPFVSIITAGSWLVLDVNCSRRNCHLSFMCCPELNQEKKASTNLVGVRIYMSKEIEKAHKYRV